jgi:hypothetical protein
VYQTSGKMVPSERRCVHKKRSAPHRARRNFRPRLKVFLTTVRPLVQTNQTTGGLGVQEIRTEFLLLCLNLSDMCFVRTPPFGNDPDIAFPDPGVLTGAQSYRQPSIVRAHLGPGSPR